MRVVNLILAIAALGGVAFLFMRDDDDGQEETRASLTAIEARLDELGADVGRLKEAQAEAAAKPPPVDAANREAVADLGRRAAVIEGYIDGLRLELSRAAAVREAADAETARVEAERAAAAAEARAAAARAAAAKAAEESGESDKWLKGLKSADSDEVFKSTLELARLGDRRAIPGLIEILSKHRDFYARLGAATALGELNAAKAVPALIDALSERDELVRTGASEALSRITKKDFKYVPGLTKAEREEIQSRYRDWWRENEDEVVRRIEDGR